MGFYISKDKRGQLFVDNSCDNIIGADFYAVTLKEKWSKEKELRDAEHKIFLVEQEGKKQLEALKEEHHYKISRLEKEFKQKQSDWFLKEQQLMEDHKNALAEKGRDIEVLKKEISILSEKYESQCKLNTGFKRQIREKANADRGISGKKTHSGYLVVSSEQYRETYTITWSYEEWKQKYPDNAYCAEEEKSELFWKSLIQSPYPAEFSFDEIYDDLMMDLESNIFKALGIKVVVDPSCNGDYLSLLKLFADTGEENWSGVYRWFVKLDCKSGYWSVVLFHNNPLSIPTEMIFKNNRTNK